MLQTLQQMRESQTQDLLYHIYPSPSPVVHAVTPLVCSEMIARMTQFHVHALSLLVLRKNFAVSDVMTELKL